MGRFRNLLRHLFRDPPGERFRRHYERQRGDGEEHPALRLFLLVAGVLLVLSGMAMLVLPGPGVLVILLGLMLIAARDRRVAHWLDRSEVAVRAHLPHRFRR